MAEVSQIRVRGTLYDIKDAVARLSTGAPATAATVAAMTDTSKIYVYTGSESGYTKGNWYYNNGSSWVSGGVYNSAAVETDTSLSVSGAPADAKVAGDAINNIVYVGTAASDSHTQVLVSPNSQEIELVTHAEFDSEISDLQSLIRGGGMSAEFKVALETLLSNVVYKGNDPTGRTYLTALHNAMYPPANLSRITAVYTQSGNVYVTDSLDVLKADLVVTAFYDNGTSEIISTYVLSGTLIEGITTITVTYGGKSTTFNVTVTDPTALPSEYQKVEWIGVENSTTTPTAYLTDEGAIGENSTLHAEFKPFSLVGQYDSPLGSYPSDLENGRVSFEIYYNNSLNEIKLDSPPSTKVTKPTLDSYVIGDSWDSIDMSFVSGSNLHILVYRTNTYAFNGKFKSLTITDSNGGLTHNYIPCYRKSDLEIGMYDVIAGKFLTNAGTGSLVKGNNV